MSEIGSSLASRPDVDVNNTLLAVSDLTVSFPRYGKVRHVVLSAVDLAISRGEIVALVGESGAGKTMLARSIMKLVPPPGRVDSGQVHFDGRELTALDEEGLRRLRGRDIAMIISNPRGELDPLETVGRQIGNVLRYHLGLGQREIRERVFAILEDVRIPDPARRYNAYPHELSGGMAQRVVMAIALACSPRFIISDDATSGLDVTVQAQVLELMTRLVADRGASMLFITRDIGIAAHYADRVAVIYAGRMVEIAARRTFFKNPSHPYSVLLLAAFSHNASLRRYWLREDAVQVAKGPAATGCAFANRCVRAAARCREEAPQLRPIGEGHAVRCHFPVERV
jgi:oligopeptide/dipeptide ABC transporter ATP-binding protein